MSSARPAASDCDQAWTRGGSRWLDRSLLNLQCLTGEQALYALFVLLAVLSRLWNLGQHILSHDETVHAQWSWYLYQGDGYSHHPLSHGPFLFHSTALAFYLFGDNEFTARLVPAILGVVLVAFPYVLRRWLSRSGALVASLLFLISPSLLYYSRYARNDVPIILWALIAVVATFRYLEAPPAAGPMQGRSRWLPILAAALALMFATKEVAFFYIAILGSFLVLLFFARLGLPRPKTPAWDHWKGVLITLLGLLGVLLVSSVILLYGFSLLELFPIHYQDCGQAPVPEPGAAGMGCPEAQCDYINGRCQKPLPVIAGDQFLEFDQMGVRVAIQLTRLETMVLAGFISVVSLVTGAAAYQVVKRNMPFRIGERPSFDLIILIGTFTLPFLAHVAISGLSRVASRGMFGIDAAFDSLDYSEAGLLRSAGFVFILLGISAAVGLWWDWRRWLISASVFGLIFVVLFTTVFTNGNGLATGMVGSLGYWLEQQAVERGSQPVYYYGLMVALYEYLPLIGFLVALSYVLVNAKVKRGRLCQGRDSFEMSSGGDEDRLDAQLSRASTTTPLSTFIVFLFYWTALSWPIYSMAGERMPWMVVHIIVPMMLVSAWIIGKLMDYRDWRAILSRGGWVVLAISPLALAALNQTLSPWFAAAAKPFSGFGVDQLNATMQFLSALFVLCVLTVVLYKISRRLGRVDLLYTWSVLALGVLVILTVRTAWAFAYVNFDNASEFLVYAHGSPEVRVVMEQIEDISQRLSGDKALDIGYTSDGSYPFIWYLRNYSNAVRLPNPPSRSDLEKPVIVAGDAEWAGIEPYLGANYTCSRYDFMWWPMQDYYGLDWQRVRYALTNPQMRGAVWDIVFRRDYGRYEQATGKTVRLSDWPLRDGVRFCVQRDVVARVWGESTRAARGEIEAVEWDADSYADLVQIVVPDLELTSLGRFRGLSSPHGLALDSQGFLYVADTGNHRIIKLSPQGQPVAAWESTWWRGLATWTAGGCLDDAGRPLAQADREMCEPWGVAVGADGRVYVADTWNHRVQIFSPAGTFLGKVGSFGQSGNAILSAPARFYGPRDLEVDGDGTIYVSDTGNKRVQVIGPDLTFQRAFGGPGVTAGRLDEPVGLGIGPDGMMFVADTWNGRVQVFSEDGAQVREWPVVGWESQSVLNKPYLAIDDAGSVYVSEPETARVMVFSQDGQPLAALDLRFIGGEATPLPVGILVDANRNIWVSDAANHRLLRFPPLDLAPNRPHD